MKIKTLITILAIIGSPQLFFGQGITIQPGGMITVQNGAKLTATGTAGITVKSDVNGTGSFLDQNATGANVTFGGTQTVERYLSGDAEYHIFSPSVVSVDLGTVFPTNQSNIWVRDYTEATNTYTNHIYSESITQGKGYTVFLSGISSTTANFTGTLGTGDLAIGSSLTQTANPGGDGWNMVGNPYPSAISWDALTKSGLLASVYVWNAATANWKSYVDGPGGLTGGIIPSGQGFFVQVTSSPTLTFTNAARVHSASLLYYKSTQLSNLLTLAVTTDANTYSDKLFVYFDSRATAGFDPDYDAYKLRGDATAPELFTAGNPILSIDARTSPQESPVIPLGFKAGADAGYTFTAEGMESFPFNTPIFLEDKVTGAKINLRQNPVYTFQSTKGEFSNRFNLLFSTVGIEENELAGVSTYAKDKIIYLKTPVALNGTVSVYNIIGQCIFRQQLQSPGIMTIPVNGTTGTYLVSLVTENGVKSRKVFVN